MADPEAGAELGECSGCHVRMTGRTIRVIDWELEAPWGKRARVRAHTCSCEPVVYELCQVGGVRFIRRTSTHGRRRIMQVSPRMSADDADRMWQLVLAGMAR
ncbi:hypothetical protein GCM10010486_40250 [Nonomuraea roseoviolacea subsp. carminata]